MDAPIASLIAKYFCIGYGAQAKKEEEEAVKIVNEISYDALKALCKRYDNKSGDYPEHEFEGAAVLAFFEKLRDDVKMKKQIHKEEQKDESI